MPAVELFGNELRQSAFRVGRLDNHRVTGADQNPAERENAHARNAMSQSLNAQLVCHLNEP